MGCSATRRSLPPRSRCTPGSRAASPAAARYSSIPAITELMNTFTLASAVSGTPLTALPPGGESPLLRPGPVQMPLAWASEREVYPGAETERQLRDALLVRPLREVLQ